MMRMAFIGLWAIAVTLGSAGASVWWQRQRSAPIAVADKNLGIELKKARPLNVPMIADGRLQGYVVAQFALSLDSAMLKKSSVDPEVFALDEAFRILYSDPTLDFRHLAKFDLGAMSKSMVERLRTRLGGDVVRDVLVQEFTYVGLSELKP